MHLPRHAADPIGYAETGRTLIEEPTSTIRPGALFDPRDRRSMENLVVIDPATVEQLRAVGTSRILGPTVDKVPTHAYVGGHTACAYCLNRVMWNTDEKRWYTQFDNEFSCPDQPRRLGIWPRDHRPTLRERTSYNTNGGGWFLGVAAVTSLIVLAVLLITSNRLP